MSTIRRIARLITPPIVLAARHELLRRVGLVEAGKEPFVGPFASWDEAVRSSDGWDASAITAKTLDAASRARDGLIAYEQDSNTHDQIEYSITILAFLVLAVARNRGRLDIIDFGGSLGTNYRQNQKLLRALVVPLTWNVVERLPLATIGIEQFATEQLKFYSSLEQAISSTPTPPSSVLFSGSLQYVDDPFAILQQVFRAGAVTIAFDRLLVSPRDDHSVFVQQPNPDIYYKATYPVWCFSKEAFIRHLQSAGYALVEYFPRQHAAPFDHCGMIFTRES